MYLNTKITASQRVQFIRGRMREGYRVARMSQKLEKPPVLGYLRYVYTDTLKFISNVSLKFLPNILRFLSKLKNGR